MVSFRRKISSLLRLVSIINVDIYIRAQSARGGRESEREFSAIWKCLNSVDFCSMSVHLKIHIHVGANFIFIRDRRENRSSEGSGQSLFWMDRNKLKTTERKIFNLKMLCQFRTEERRICQLVINETKLHHYRDRSLAWNVFAATLVLVTTHILQATHNNFQVAWSCKHEIFFHALTLLFERGEHQDDGMHGVCDKGLSCWPKIVQKRSLSVRLGVKKLPFSRDDNWMQQNKKCI